MPPLFEGYPQKWAVKRETRQTRLRLKHVSFLVRFATRFCGDIQAEPLGRDRIWSFVDWRGFGRFIFALILLSIRDHALLDLGT